MPPPTLWTPNPNQQVSASQGNSTYDNSAITYDQVGEYYDGAPPANLTNVYTPTPKVWITPNPDE